MRLDKFTSIGLYSPSFFKIVLDSGDNVEELFTTGISTRGEAAFVHEYIHLLQDLCTNSGLSNICRTVDYLKGINHFSKFNKDIVVPYKPNDTDEFNIGANMKLYKVLSGSSNTNNSKIRNITFSCKNLYFNGQLYPVYCCIINFEINEKIVEYTVGEYAISESMSYYIENTLYPNAIEKPKNYPYNVVGIVADKLCPGFSTDCLRLITLCDATLMFFNPGEVLYRALLHFNSIDYTSFTYYEIHDIITNLIEFEFEGCTNPKQLFNKLSQDALKQTNDYFTTENYLENKSWMKDIFEISKNLRTE